MTNNTTDYEPVNPEIAFVNAFILSERRERWVYILSRPKRRREFIAELAHFKNFDERWLRKIPHAQETPEGIRDVLRAAGASETCWVISSCSEMDNQEQPLLESLRLLFCTGYDSIISCIPGHLAYVENEEGRWIAKR